MARGTRYFDKGVKRVSKWHFSKFFRLEALIFKGLRYSDVRTTNQKVVGSNPAGLTNGEAPFMGAFSVGLSRKDPELWPAGE